jgi:hypothetical protein
MLSHIPRHDHLSAVAVWTLDFLFVQSLMLFQRVQPGEFLIAFIAHMLDGMLTSIVFPQRCPRLGSEIAIRALIAFVPFHMIRQFGRNGEFGWTLQACVSVLPRVVVIHKLMIVELLPFSIRLLTPVHIALVLELHLLFLLVNILRMSSQIS